MFLFRIALAFHYLCLVIQGDIPSSGRHIIKAFCFILIRETTKFQQKDKQLQTLMLACIHPEHGASIYRHGVGWTVYFCAGYLVVPLNW